MTEQVIIRDGVEYHLIPIEGNEHYYVSRCGKLWSTYKDKMLADRIQKVRGKAKYYKNLLCLNGKTKGMFRHRIVAITFMPNPNNLPQVDHIDNDGFNNHVYNLRWVDDKTNKRNMRIREDNTSGVTGVCFCKNTGVWAAQWYDLETGKYKRKAFSINKYEEEDAFRLACEYRKKMVAEMNKQGAGYAESHGGF